MKDEAGQEIELGMWNRLLEEKQELIAEVKRLRKELEETDNRLYVAEDVLGRSGFWYDVYDEEISEEEE